MSKINIKTGEEFQIHIERKLDETSYFWDKYEKAKGILQEIFNAQDGNKKDVYDYPNNIIAFCGNRGSGKTSTMLTFMNELKKTSTEGSNLFRGFQHSFSMNSFLFIDPHQFDSVHNILDLILGHMFRTYEDSYKKNNKISSKEKRLKILEAFQKTYKHVSLMANTSKIFDAEYDYDGNIQKLSLLGESARLKEDIQELVQLYLEACTQKENGKQKLIIAIDDLDLNNVYTYRLTEQIRKYLIVPNIIILVSVNMKQLELGVREEMLNTYKQGLEFCDKNEVIKEIDKTVNQYILKLLPEHNRIDLNESMLSDETSIVIDDGMPISIKDYMIQKMAEKFEYYFEDNKSNDIYYFIPRNLRKLVGLIKNLNTDNISSNELLNYIYDVWLIDDRNKKLVDSKEEHILKNTQNYIAILEEDLKEYGLQERYNEEIVYETGIGRLYDLLIFHYKYASSRSSRILNHSIKLLKMLDNKRNPKDELLFGVFGKNYDMILKTDENRFSRNLFRLPVEDICNTIYRYLVESDENITINDEKFLSENTLNIFENSSGYLKINELKNENLTVYKQIWILSSLFTVCLKNNSSDKQYRGKERLIYSNRKINVSIYIDFFNYMGSLVDLVRTIDTTLPVELRLLDLEYCEEVQKLNRKQIEIFRKIIDNPELYERFCEYANKNYDSKEKFEDSKARTVGIVEKFWSNLSEFLKKYNMDVDKDVINTIYFPNENKEIKEVHISKLYAELYAKAKTNYDEESESRNQNYYFEICNGNEEKIEVFKRLILKVPNKKNKIPTRKIVSYIQSNSITNAKRVLENLAYVINQYAFIEKKIPECITNFGEKKLIQIYELLLRNEKGEMSSTTKDEINILLANILELRNFQKVYLDN